MSCSYRAGHQYHSETRREGGATSSPVAAAIATCRKDSKTGLFRPGPIDTPEMRACVRQKLESRGIDAERAMRGIEELRQGRGRYYAQERGTSARAGSGYGYSRGTSGCGCRKTSGELRDHGAEPRDHGAEPRDHGAEPRDHGAEPRDHRSELSDHGTSPYVLGEKRVIGYVEEPREPEELRYRGEVLDHEDEVLDHEDEVLDHEDEVLDHEGSRTSGYKYGGYGYGDYSRGAPRSATSGARTGGCGCHS
jgi:hypothetical protein